MFQPIYDAIADAASGEIALGYTGAISQHHRIQASPGYRAAAEWAAATLAAAGVETIIERYPARFDARAWASDHWPEWNCTRATLRVVAPHEAARELGLLADFEAVKLAVIQRSLATPPGGITAPLVLVESGDEPEDYTGLDVRGAVVFGGGDARRMHELAVERFGALGIVTDRMAAIAGLREPLDLPDARQYTSFWWTGSESRRAWGFVLTPRQGQALRRRLRGQAEPLLVHAEVVAELRDGTMENVVATIPGETDEDVLVIGHLCHPQPSANDNASGAAATMEIARVLRQLINQGRLARPRRTIRCLLVPEITGSYAYLAMHEERIPRTVAAINLDMVGEDPAQTASTYLVVRSPIQTEGATGVLAARILEWIVSHDRRSFSGRDGFAGFAYAVTPFTDGSDHYVYGDPTVGIPCPQILNWPDRYYHTSADTIEKVSPAVLRRSVLLAGTYVYFLAAAGELETRWLANELAADLRADLANRTRAALAEAFADPAGADQARAGLDRLGVQLQFRGERYQANLRSLLRLSPAMESEIERLARDGEDDVLAEKRRAGEAFASLATDLPPSEASTSAPAELSPVERDAAGIVLRRRHRGPLPTRYFERYLHAEQRESLRRVLKEHPRGLATVSQALYWMDGERSLLEVANALELETGVRDVPFLVALAGFLEASAAVTRVAPPVTPSAG